MKRFVLYAATVYCVLFFTGTAAAISSVQTEHFRVVAEGSNIQESDLKKVGEGVEEIYKQVSDFLGVGYTNSGKIEVRVYVTPKKGKPLRAAASGATLFLTLGRMDNDTLRHELAHILIAKPLSSAPRWFHEGLAMYIGSGDMRIAYDGGLAPFKDFTFIRLDAGFEADKSERNAYLYSWAIVSYVIDTYGKDKLKDIFKQHGSFGDKFSKAFGVDLRTIEKKANEIFAGYK